MTRVVLLHGAATTARVWDGLAALLTAQHPAYDVVALDRPRTGDLDRELAWLAPRVADAWVIGMSGGATLGLALAASGVPLAGALLHEPAAGSLAPDLLTPAADAFARGGTAAFGAALYGSSWRPAMAGDVDDTITAAELAMFRAFEPAPAASGLTVVVTYGARSPAARRSAAYALRDAHGYRVDELPGSGHFVAVDSPVELARVIDDLIATTVLRPAP